MNEVLCEYIGVGCNRTGGALDWGSNDVIIYGAAHSVAVTKTNSSGVHSVWCTPCAHSGRVNCVSWIQNSEDEFISGGTDHNLILWTKHEHAYTHTIAKGHSGSVNAVDGIRLSPSSLLLASSSADSTIRIWSKQEQGEVVCVDVISLGTSFGLCVRLLHLDDSSPILLTGGDDSKLSVYTDSNDNYKRNLTLSGHEDWLLNIHTCKYGEDWLVVSSSKDTCIRVWRISKSTQDDTQSQLLQLKKDTFTNKHRSYTVCLESVLSGHTSWVYSVRWASLPDGSVYLLSSGTDKTVIVWKLDSSSGLWLESARLGGVGGQAGGFYGACWSPHADAVIAHSYTGGLYMWNNKEDSWSAGVISGGHYDEVHDIDWEPTSGNYLLSTSKDQTTRLHAKTNMFGWHELGRAQIHGYDLTSVTCITELSFASAAEEKVIRAFTAPQNFIDNFKNLTTHTLHTPKDAVPTGASVPSLGLSNKAVFNKDLENVEKERNPAQYPEITFTPQTFTVPPSEDVLQQNTLWPEVSKLYGHGYEVYTLTANHKGTLLASACKAATKQHATVIIWDVVSWTQVIELEHHSLTVTQVQFSPDDKLLLTVSRDRTWALYNTQDGFSMVSCTNKKTCVHSRIIWSCSWSPDSLYFTTASRDKRLCTWGGGGAEWGSVGEPLELRGAVTALAHAPLTYNSVYMLAAGMESGDIHIYTWSSVTTQWTHKHSIHKLISPHLTVKRLRWRPLVGDVLQLCSASYDHSVRVYNVQNVISPQTEE